MLGQPQEGSEQAAPGASERHVGRSSTKSPRRRASRVEQEARVREPDAQAPDATREGARQLLPQRGETGLACSFCSLFKKVMHMR